MKEFKPHMYGDDQKEMVEKYSGAVHKYLTKELVLEGMYQIHYNIYGAEAQVYDLLQLLLEEGPTTLSDLTNGEMCSEDWDSFYEREDWADFFEILTGVKFREGNRDDYYYYWYDYKPSDADKERKRQTDLAEIAIWKKHQIDEVLLNFTNNRYYLNDSKMLFVEYANDEFRMHHLYFNSLHECKEWVSEPMCAQGVEILIEELE